MTPRTTIGLLPASPYGYVQAACSCATLVRVIWVDAT
jgi:hypothetical protein